MNTKSLTDDSFDELLDSAEDITHSFDLDMGGLPDDVLKATNDVKPFITTLRLKMMNHVIKPTQDLSKVEFGLINMQDWADCHGALVQDEISQGNIMAVDGTPLIHHQRFLTQQIYACAVGGLTARAPMNLRAKVVKVKASLEGSNSKIDDVLRIITQSDNLSESSSWPSAFLEYQEREFALNSEYGLIIIDGPIVTQNLLTRRSGRDLFRKMLGKPDHKVYVGITKNMLTSNAELRFQARALNAGELFIQGTLNSSFTEERKVLYGGDTRRFIEGIGANIFRGVYKAGQKAFGFECMREDLPVVVSLLWLDKNSTPGYELPFLLSQVDAQLRGRYRPSETMSVIEGMLARQGEDEFFDEMDERNLR